MTTTLPQLNSPVSLFNDLSGNLLEGGYVYYGEDGLDPENNPIDVYFDEDGTIPAPQPIRTLSGNPVNIGTPSNIFIAEENYSITVLDKNRNLIYTILHNHITNVETINSEIDILQIANTIFDTTGGTTAYSVTTGLTSIQTGTLIWVRLNVSSTVDTPTINVDGILGAIDILKIGTSGSTTAISKEELIEGSEIRLYYNGTVWLMVGIRSQEASQTQVGVSRAATSDEIISNSDSTLFVSPTTFIKRPQTLITYSQSSSSSPLWSIATGSHYIVPLDTIVYDELGISLNSNVITIPDGDYYIEIEVPIYIVLQASTSQAAGSSSGFVFSDIVVSTETGFFLSPSFSIVSKYYINRWYKYLGITYNMDLNQFQIDNSVGIVEFANINTRFTVSSGPLDYIVLCDVDSTNNDSGGLSSGSYVGPRYPWAEIVSSEAYMPSIKIWRTN